MSLQKPSYHRIYVGEKGDLFLGNWGASLDKDLLAKIGAVVNCTKAAHPLFKGDVSDEKAFLRVDLQADGLEKFENSYRFIGENLEKGNNVLVHCAAGACRSVAVCLYFLMKKNGWTLVEAHRNLKKIRPEIADLSEGALTKFTSQL